MSKKKVNTIFTEDESKDRRKLLTAIAVILSVAAVILIAVLLVNLFGTKRLVSKDGGGRLIDNSENITYTLVVPCPYWVNLDISKPYAECDGVNYYQIIYTDTDGVEKNFDPKKMIATYDEDLLIVSLYVADNFSLPSLEEMDAASALPFYVQIEEYPAGSPINFTYTKTITQLILTKEAAVYPSPSTIDTDTRLDIRLVSQKHPYLQYIIEYFETLSGDIYLQDTATGKCVKATDELKELFATSEEN